MFSVNNFYDYLIHKYSDAKKSNSYFYSLNSNDIRNISQPNLLDKHFVSGNNLQHLRYSGAYFLLDQEPFNFSEYYFTVNNNKHKNLYNFIGQNHNDLLLFAMARMQPTIICHSEKSSQDIMIFNDHDFLDIHYWYHGFISRDWFRHWKHYTTSTEKSKRFGLYARDASGTRKYRLKLLEHLTPINNQVYFKLQNTILKQNPPLKDFWEINNQEFDSNSSASISWEDTEKFDIQIVAETLFDTQKIHLTEKILKPIVMKQPFILFAGPHSLRYLKKYGFRTFGEIWNEEYDDILDSTGRFNQATKMIKRIAKLPEDEYKKVLEKTQEIVEYNHKHLFSDKFEQILLKELHDGFEFAFFDAQELMQKDPGGPLYKLLDRFVTNGLPLEYLEGTNTMSSLKYVYKNHPDQFKAIARTYSWVNQL